MPTPSVDLAAGHTPSLFHTDKGYRWTCSCGTGMPEHLGWEDISIAANSWGVHMSKVNNTL